MDDNHNRTKKISPAALHSLKEALTYAYWYKNDLKSFLYYSLNDKALVSKLNWDDYKRNIVGQLIDYLSRNEDIYQEALLNLMTDTAKIENFSHLERVEDSKKKIERAERSINALKEQIQGHEELLNEKQEIEKRRKKARKKRMEASAVQQKLKELTDIYYQLISSDKPQKRGYKLEKILNDLFELFDLDPKASFRNKGEQIDGAFTFGNTDYLLEAKWSTEKISAKELDSFKGKLSRKLENTLGLFISINGFSRNGVDTHSSGRSLMILMDGADLMAVIEGRIDLVHLLQRKRRAASQRGNIYLKVNEILMNNS